MRKFVLLLTVAVGLLAVGIYAQESGQRTKSNPSVPVGGKVEAVMHPEFIPEDLDDLVKWSPLIVRGIVSMQLPARCTDADCSFLYTDFEFAVKKLLKEDGTNRKFDKVIVSQDGGKLGELEATVHGDPLMQEGEEYILCLAFDPREDRLQYDGARWVVRGIYHGKFKIENEKVVVGEKSVFQRMLHGSLNPISLENTSVADLVSQIERAVTK